MFSWLLVLFLGLSLLGGGIIARHLFRKSLIDPKEDRAESKMSDKIAIFAFFLLVLLSVFVFPFFLQIPVLVFPFILYGLWGVFSKRIWVPAGWEPTLNTTVEPVKHFWHGREAVLVGGWFLLVGSLLAVLYLLLFPLVGMP
jgi:hypothetical protein